MHTVTEHDALGDLRRARRKNRLAELDWFEAAYRVYLVAFAFGGSALWLSGFVKDEKVSPATVADIYRYGPAVMGMFAVLAFAAGMRSGSRGGPLAIEEADVRHVLLSPVDRRAALLRPATQRARSAAFSGLIVGALAGELAGRRLPGSVASWTFTGAAFGASLSVLFVGAALVAHAVRVPRWMASIIGALAIGWQSAAIVKHIVGPANLLGSLSLWGMRERAIDLVAPAVIVAIVAVGLLLLRRTSLDALARRSGLVAQLHFAVTMQDLRTVMLLRRQLSQENTRSRPWVRLRRSGGSAAIWRRGWHSLLRFPVSRLLRMSVLAVAAAACQVASYNGTSAMFLISGALLFLLGMEAMEPLSQEIDQPDRMASLPHERGELLLRHTLAPLVALVPFAGIGVVTVALLERSKGAAGAAAVAGVLALPTVWAGAAGAVVSVVKDAPDLMNSAVEQTMMPPEMSGMTTIVRMLLPLVVSIIGSISVLAVRSAHTHGTSELATAIRMAVAQLLLCGLIGWWVRRRDAWKVKLNAFMSEGKQVTAQQRAARAESSRRQP
ncbi:unannotated protein [freshwater metagenome]|uniref:Unannotated protein n=1 Tax=freshwater metagenome TaxID=449393 RepID=A0A6J7EKD8_9ZZZZ